MNRTLFITGSSGFIGKHILQRLPLNQYEHIYCLDYTQTDQTKELTRRENFHFIQGNLLEPATYERQLSEADTVFHWLR